MIMLDEEESLHALREDYVHLSDIEWSAVERMCSTVGETAISAMVEFLDRAQQHAAIAKFSHNELATEREKVALLHQQGSQQAEQLRELGAQQTELLRQQQFNAAVGGTTHTRRPETLKVEISKYRGVEEDFLLLWFVELDGAIKARRVDDEQMRLTFAHTHLAGRATTWALGLEMSDLNTFGSPEAFKSRLKQTFEPTRAEFRDRSELLKLNQGKRDVHAYAQHIRLLASSIVANPVHEHTLITVFMQGLVEGPVRNHLFRLELYTLEQAISAAEREDFSMRQAHASLSSYRPPRRQENGVPEPMDLCYVESERPRSSNYKRLQKCNLCQKLGHYAYECSAPRPVPSVTERRDRPFVKRDNGHRSNAVAKPQQRTGP